ncbi:MAG: hypothetical protein ACI81R_000304 [Bradymonadia bacterium]|jgi:hypothetical protein
MIAQNRNGSFWLVTQVDHALQCEQLARACLIHAACDDVLLACRHHDDGWRPMDAQPRWSSAGLTTFENWPANERPAIWASCIDRTAEVSLYAGVIASLHFTAFIDAESAFARERATQRVGWLRTLGRSAEEAAHDYALLRAIDWISLLFCAARPGAKKPPSWLTLRVPYDDAKWSARWVSDDELQVRTDAGDAVFEPTTIVTPTRRLGGRAIESETKLAAAWRCAPVHPVRFKIR